MAFEVAILPDAQKQLYAIGQPTARRILKKIFWIFEQNDPLRYAVILHNPKSGDIRFRVGDYRAVAVIDKDKKKITIIKIGHRRDIYR